MARLDINGVLLLDKPFGLSSNQALQRVKRIFHAAKAGHTGTLDPIATGLLPICFGEATKFSSYLLDANKEYIATVKFGQATTTYDDQGDTTHTGVVLHTEGELLACLKFFTGEIHQVPPIYSALKVNGRPLYSYARNNEEVEIKSRTIKIYELELVEIISFDEIKIRVLSSKGTYIRSLINDIGKYLGCYAHMTGLVRTKTNNFVLANSYTVDLLKEYDTTQLNNILLPIDCMLSDLTKVDISQDELLSIKNGKSFTIQDVDFNGDIRVYCQDKFLGVGNIQDKLFTPIRLINTSEL